LTSVSPPFWTPGLDSVLLFTFPPILRSRHGHVGNPMCLSPDYPLIQGHFPQPFVRTTLSPSVNFRPCNFQFFESLFFPFLLFFNDPVTIAGIVSRSVVFSVGPPAGPAELSGTPFLPFRDPRGFLTCSFFLQPLVLPFRYHAFPDQYYRADTFRC